MSQRLPPRPVPATFRPRFTLMLLYLALAFVLYCFLFALPDLIRVAQTTTPGPEQQELAKQAAYTAVRPKLLIAFVAAVATVAAGAYTGRLPGLRTR